MRAKLTLVIILMVFLIASASHFIVLAANEAPHNASNLYLATGTIISNTYNSEDNTTELIYSSITYKG
jgi:hypothetical protein